MASDSTGKSVLRRVLVSLVLIVVLLGVGAFGFMKLQDLKKAPERTAGHPPRTAVLFESAARSDHREVAGGYGRARPLRAAEVSAEVAALVTWVSPELEAGNHVAGDAELVRLDDRDFRLALARAEATEQQAQAEITRHKDLLENLDAQIRAAESELQTAERELDRLRGLSRTGAASPSELDRQQLQTSTRELAVLALRSRRSGSVADLARAEAELTRARAAVQQARNDIERTVVRAPYAGRIRDRSAQPGSRVAPGTLLFRIVDTTRVEVPIALPASRFGRVTVGSPATIRLSESGDAVWTGPVARVAPGVDPESRTFQVFLVVEAPVPPDGSDTTSESPVPPGAFVVAEIDSTLHRGVFVIPRAAFVGDVVYIAEVVEPEDGASTSGTAMQEALVHERRPAVLLRLPDVVLATGGLERDELIVISNVEDIGEGTRVRLISAGGGDTAATEDTR